MAAAAAEAAVAEATEAAVDEEAAKTKSNKRIKCPSRFVSSFRPFWCLLFLFVF